MKEVQGGGITARFRDPGLAVKSENRIATGAPLSATWVEKSSDA